MGYLSKEGFRNIYVNRLMSLASVSVLFSCLVMIGTAFLLFVNVTSMVGNIEDKNIITVYYPDGTEGYENDEFGVQIAALDNVKFCEFVPNEVAFQEQLDNSDPVLSAYLVGGEKIFPDAYKVTVEDMSQYAETVGQLKLLNPNGTVRGSTDLASKLDSVRSTVTYISIGFIAILLIVSLFIISNTIRITMFNRRLEINIMRSVGATRWFIRWPFMLEGMILGAFSGILAFFAVWGIYKFAVSSLIDLFTGMGGNGVLPFSRYAAYILLSFILLGVFTGAFGSTFSISKYLKEQEYAKNEETI